MSWQANATHNRAGEITYEQIGDLTIRATIVTYTRTSSFAADRDSLTLYWGDGDSTVVTRSNGNGFELPNDIKRNEYIQEHTYPTRGTYKLSMTDPNRIAGILNIDPPNSVNIRFYIETTFTLLEPRFQGRNNSAILLQPPIDFACVGEVYSYNPNAYDKDGDSLTYELVTPFAQENVRVPNYELPDQIAPGPDNMIFLNVLSGDFIWEAPQFTGEYNITYKINEYREGVLINSIIRDMQILVRPCPDNNNPPMIESPEIVCVIAGEMITINLLASDVDSNEVLSITTSGGPFELTNSPAQLTVDLAIANSMLRGGIIWQTNCDHISREFYQIVVRVTDDLSRPNSALATLRTIKIKIVAPPPLNPVAVNTNGTVTLRWDHPYQCDTGTLFQGFSVWRKLRSTSIPIDTCNGGLEGQGYERIIFLTNETSDNRFVAYDAEIDPGEIYCYRILAEYAELTVLGNPYNTVQSLTSEEVCVLSSGDEPLIKKVSVITTDESDGMIVTEWINPTIEYIDTTILTGPYQINISGANDLEGTNLTTLQSFNYSIGDFNDIHDTLINVRPIDTKTTGHSFEVSFMSGNNSASFKSTSDIASSVYLTVRGSDQSVILNWQENVPWNNYLYRIYEIRDGQSILIDSTQTNTYAVEGLINGLEYCYLIESIGKYNIVGIPEPLENLSNVNCGIAMDDVAPCPPEIVIKSICDDINIDKEIELVNTVIWSYNSGNCSKPGDIQSFRIYYAERESEPVSLLQEVDGLSSRYFHSLIENIAGCYSVTAIDLSGNESLFSKRICVDNCPSYVLPNTFTPNNDNSNDLFIPRKNRFIDKVDFKVYNRWGQKVFETSDPSISWNGQNLSNKELAEGTYYYSCQIFEKRVSGITEGEILKGTIQLIR